MIHGIPFPWVSCYQQLVNCDVVKEILLKVRKNFPPYRRRDFVYGTSISHGFVCNLSLFFLWIRGHKMAVKSFKAES